MKFSIVAAISAIALAVSSEAAQVKIFNLQDAKGDCSVFPVDKYDTCYTISQFYLPRTASFHNDDSSTSKLSITFYETGNCGGKYYRLAGDWKTKLWYTWGTLGNVNGIAGSFMLTKGGSFETGTVNQYKAAEFAKLAKC